MPPTTKKTFRRELFAFVLVCLVFALLYTVVLWDSRHFRGIDPQTDVGFLQKLGNRFYFSSVTTSTIGYGDITPQTHVARALVSVHAVISLVQFVHFFV